MSKRFAISSRHFVPAALWPDETPQDTPHGPGWLAAVLSCRNKKVKFLCDGEKVAAEMSLQAFAEHCTPTADDTAHNGLLRLIGSDELSLVLQHCCLRGLSALRLTQRSMYHAVRTLLAQLRKARTLKAGAHKPDVLALDASGDLLVTGGGQSKIGTNPLDGQLGLWSLRGCEGEAQAPRMIDVGIEVVICVAAHGNLIACALMTPRVDHGGWSTPGTTSLAVWHASSGELLARTILGSTSGARGTFDVRQIALRWVVNEAGQHHLLWGTVGRHALTSCELVESPSWALQAKQMHLTIPDDGSIGLGWEGCGITTFGMHGVATALRALQCFHIGFTDAGHLSIRGGSVLKVPSDRDPQASAFWQERRRVFLHPKERGERGITCVALSEKWVAHCQESPQRVYVWSLPRGAFEYDFMPRGGMRACTLALALQGDYLLQGGNVSGEVQVWHLGSAPTLVGMLHGHAGSVTSLRCLPDCRAIVSGSTSHDGADSLIIRWRPHLFV